ncbi:uncharacterized protein LOC124448359 [Xenia sp. Carnegie-2017]|uniref:uncharacterized protein LOC124448359 n=1 Tax=Xenia sp. Carnegie-2017 TaxID=2897299 RepID=UPI001F041060|nr:uncharacterized protein LOC124448359 [Xenia sp. Carnegie-2017]
MTSQGKVTNTVLTNLSDYLLVVSNEPYSTRRDKRFGLPSLRSSSTISWRPARRGRRPLHMSTPNLFYGDKIADYKSITKDSFGGKCDLQPVQQLNICPSLHSSQFDFGIDSQFHHSTTNGENFKKYSKVPGANHVDRSRWIDQMAGHSMAKITRHGCSNNVDFSTTYSKNHQMTRPHCPPDKFNGRWKTSIYTICPGNTGEKKYHSISANEYLVKRRKKLANGSHF